MTQSKTNGPKVAIIILNFNVSFETLKCVASVNNSTYNNFEILVVDNGSTDDSAAVLAAKLPKEVTFIKNQNTGYAGGNNLGLRWALKHGADYALILNPDTAIDPGAVSELVNYANAAGTKIGFMGPRIFLSGNVSEPTIYSDGGRIHWTLTRATLAHHGESASRLELNQNPFSCDYVTGTALFVSRAVLEKVGLIREDYFLYYEDTDWSLRCRRLGYKLMIVPSAKVYHEESKSTGLLSPRYIYYNTRNGLYLALWNGSMVLRWLARLNSIFKLFKQPIKYFLRPSQRHWIKPVTRAIIDVWLGRTGRAVWL